MDPPPGGYERVHAAHFYGHLDAGQRAAWLETAAALAPELVIVDSALRPDGEPEAWQERRLNDGSRHRVYKRWFTPSLARGRARRRRDAARGPLVRRRPPRGQTPFRSEMKRGV